MIFDENRFKGVSDKTKMIMLEVENDAMQGMLFEVLASLAILERDIQTLRHTLYLEIDDTEQIKI